MVGDGTFSQNVEGHLNCITSSRVTAILLNGWILPIGGASAMEGLLLTQITQINDKTLFMRKIKMLNWSCVSLLPVSCGDFPCLSFYLPTGLYLRKYHDLKEGLSLLFRNLHC